MFKILLASFRMKLEDATRKKNDFYKFCDKKSNKYF